MGPCPKITDKQLNFLGHYIDKKHLYEIALAIYDGNKREPLPTSLKDLSEALKQLENKDFMSYDKKVKTINENFYTDYHKQADEQKKSFYDQVDIETSSIAKTRLRSIESLQKDIDMLSYKREYSLLNFRIVSDYDRNNNLIARYIEPYTKEIKIWYQKQSFYEDIKVDNKDDNLYKKSDKDEYYQRATTTVNKINHPEEENFDLCEFKTMIKFKTTYPSMDEASLKKQTVSLNGKPHTFEEYKSIVKKDLENRRLIGNIRHRIFLLLSTEDTIERNHINIELNNFVKLLDINEDKKKDYLVYEQNMMRKIYDSYIKPEIDICGTKPMTEITLGIQGIRMPYKDKDGNMIKTMGIAGTLDVLIDYGNGEYAIYDYKTGSLSNTSKDIFEYSMKLPEYKQIYSTDLHKAELKNVLYAMMVKATLNKNARFRSINLLKVTRNSDSGAVLYDMMDMTNPSNIRIGDYINMIKAYFSDIDPDFVNNKDNAYLFDADNYFTNIIEKTVKPIDGKVEFYNIRYRRKLEELYNRLDELSVIETRSELSKKEVIEKKNITEQIANLTTGKHLFQETQRTFRGLIYSQLTPIGSVNNAFTSFINQIYQKANKGLKGEINDLSREYEKRFSPLIKKTWFHTKAGYRENYEWMWTDHPESDSYIGGGYWLKTWKDEGWNELSEDQKRFLDFHRWMIRYILFSTMDAKKGIDFIDTELRQRKDLSVEDKEELNQQKDILSKINQRKRWQGSRMNENIYFEGWTPRASKQSEEMTDVKEIKSSKIYNFMGQDPRTLSNITIQNKQGKTTGLPVLHNNIGSESGIAQREGKFTFNPQIIMAEWMRNMLRKKYYDDVVNITFSTRDLLMELDKYNSKPVNNMLIEYLNDFVRVQLKEQQNLVLGNLNDKVVTLPDGTQKIISLDKMAQSLRSKVGFIALAGHVVSGLRTGVTQGAQAWNKALAGTIHNLMIQDKNQKVDFTLGSLSYATWEAMKFIGAKYFTGKLTKTGQLMDQLGMFVESYDYQQYYKSKFSSVEGKIFKKKFSNDDFYFFYRIFDEITYVSYFVGLTSRMHTTKNGKDINMLDAYEMDKNGKMIYTGDVRYIDEVTGEKIGELTPGEMNNIKGFFRENVGAMHDDERVPLEGNIIGMLLIQFRHFAPMMLHQAWKRRGLQTTLRDYMLSDNYVVIDENRPDISGQTIHRDSPEFLRYSREKVVMVPIGKEVEQMGNGYIRGLLSAVYMLRYFITDKNKFWESWKGLSKYEKTNILFAINKLGMWLALGYVLNNVIGNSDQKKTNKWILAAHLARTEIAFEFLFTDYKNLPRTLLSAPTLTTTVNFFGAASEFIYNIITNRRVMSGEYKDYYKGEVSFYKMTPYLSMEHDIYDMFKDWGTITQDADKAVENMKKQALGRGY